MPHLSKVARIKISHRDAIFLMIFARGASILLEVGHEPDTVGPGLGRLYPARGEREHIMDIRIKQIGQAIGTSGWLKSGLADGTITIEEGISKSGKIALYLCTPREKLCLAIWNPYDLTNRDVANSEAFFPLKWSASGCDPDAICNYRNPYTIAVKRALQGVADQWCEQRNAIHGADEPLPLTLTVER
jgi:hypothetical protein